MRNKITKYTPSKDIPLSYVNKIINSMRNKNETYRVFTYKSCKYCISIKNDNTYTIDPVSISRCYYCSRTRRGNPTKRIGTSIPSAPVEVPRPSKPSKEENTKDE